MTSALKLKNNATSLLSASISNIDTAISLVPGTGVRFPTIVPGEWFPLTLVAIDGTFEIVRATARSGDVMTIVRAQEGTLAVPFSAGDRLESRFTAGAFTEEIARVEALTSSSSTLRADLADPSGSGATLMSWIQAGVGAVMRYIQDKLREHPSVSDFGAIGDGVVDDAINAQKAATAKSLVEVAAGTYKMSVFPVKTNTRFIALGTVVMNLFKSIGVTDERLVQFKSGSFYDGFTFNSLETDLNSVRGAIEDEVNVSLARCAFIGFRNPTVSNAWGNHIARSTGVLLDNCIYGTNTQADIAVTDSVRDLVVINPVNTIDGGVNLNIEPNTNDGLRGANFIGGHYRKVQLLEGQTNGYAGQGLVFSGCRIDQLVYDGSGATFIGCQIGSIVPEGSALTLIFAGPLSIDSCDLGVNLLDDPYLVDVSPSDTSCFWTSYASTGPTHQRVNDAAHGKYIKVNPTRISQQVILTTRSYIPVVAGEVFMAFMRSRCYNSGTGVMRGEHMVLQWFTAGFVEIQTTHVCGNRVLNNVDSDWNNDVCTPKAPVGAAFVKVRISTFYDGSTTSALDVAAVGFFRFSLLSNSNGGGNQPQVIGALSVPVTQSDYRVNAFPVGTAGYSGCFVGERLILRTPVVATAGIKVCTVVPGVVGAAGTFANASSVVGDTMAGAAATTSGATLATLEANVNLIITSLKAANKMNP